MTPALHETLFLTLVYHATLPLTFVHTTISNILSACHKLDTKLDDPPSPYIYKNPSATLKSLTSQHISFSNLSIGVPQELVNMAKLVSLFLALSFLAAMSAIGSHADGDCENDLHSLISDCKSYVMFPANPKVPPSDACCGVIKKANVSCLCSKVTKEIEKVVCMEKVVYVAEQCKRPFEHGFQCGSECFLCPFT
jgi:hypothetical protein